MLHDLVFYFSHHGHLIPAPLWANPVTASLFMQKIVAAHYLQLVDYIKAALPSLEMRLSTGWTEEEEQWRSLQTISRRCGNYRDDVEDTLLSLGLGLGGGTSEGAGDEGAGIEAAGAVTGTTAAGPEPGGPGAVVAAGPEAAAVATATTTATPRWVDPAPDFNYIYLRLKLLKSRADTLIGAMTGLASIAGNRQALDEAKRSKRLTLVGLVFIPLAYSSSLFSMSNQFAPGQSEFWVYWVVAVVLILLTFCGTWALELVLDDEAGWSLGGLRFWGKGKGERRKGKRVVRRGTGFWGYKGY